jgi:hypothetical protein
MSVKLNDEHQVPWRAPQVGRLLVFRGVRNRKFRPQPPGVRRMRRTGVQGRTPWACAKQGLRSAMALRRPGQQVTIHAVLTKPSTFP